LDRNSEREHGLLRLAPERALVRQEERPRELLRQRAAPLEAPAANVAIQRAPEAHRIDAEVRVEAMILDRDDGVLQVARDLIQRDVAALLVHAEPGAPVRRVEPGVADTAAQLVDGPSLPHRPQHDDRRDRDEAAVEAGGDPILDLARDHRGARRECSTSESTM
jgi:hypothetical protein